MRILYAAIPFLLLFLTISSCKKDPVTTFDFSKYTATDSGCIVVGFADMTDWTRDTTWSNSEKALMNFADEIVLIDTLIGSVEVSPICPNPNGGLFIVGVNTERECKMKVACVNTEMETLYYTSKKLTGGPIVTAYDFRSLTAFHKQMNYRLYYAFYNANDSLYYAGHGDFRIE